MNKKQAEREAFFDFYKQTKEQTEEEVYEPIIIEPRPLPTEKEQNKDWMYQQRERNELGADYFSYQGYHPPKK